MCSISATYRRGKRVGRQGGSGIARGQRSISCRQLVVEMRTDARSHAAWKGDFPDQPPGCLVLRVGIVISCPPL